MKRFIIGAALALATLVSGAASASTSSTVNKMDCVRNDGSQHRVYTSGTAVQFGTTVFNFVKTGTLEGGTEVYMFRSGKAGQMLALAKSTDGLVYQIRNENLDLIDEGICK